MNESTIIALTFGLSQQAGVAAIVGAMVEAPFLLGAKATKEGASDAKMTAKKVAHYSFLAFAAIIALGITAFVGFSATLGVVAMMLRARIDSAAIPLLAGAGAMLLNVYCQYRAFKWALN